MLLTYNHPKATSRRPVFVDENGAALSYSDGFIKLARAQNWKAADLAVAAGVSTFTVYGWRQGRDPSDGALVQLFRHLNAMSR